MTQRFKENDVTEPIVTNLFLSVLEELGADRDTFFDNAFLSYLLGDVLFDLNRDPLADVITREVFRASFPAIHDLFTRPGTFEFYLDVFRSVFTADTDIEFTIPGPGQLVIDVSAVTLEQFPILARRIVDDVYIYDNLVTSDTNENIVAQGISGIKTQSEMDGLAAEISAYGIFTTVNLIT